MINILSIKEDIKFGVLDLLRNIGMGIINTIYSTIDTLYEVGNTINSLNIIQMLQDLENSPFTKIFNAFFILSFVVLFLFAVWKITFRIFDADSEEQPLFILIKEIVKCGFLIFSISLIFNTTIDVGKDLSSAIYNNFNTKSSSIGAKMESAYLNVNDKCYVKKGGESVDKKNVSNLKSYLNDNIDTKSVKTMEDFEKLIRNNTISAKDLTESDAFLEQCDIYNQTGGDKKDYAFNYNFLFGIVIGVIFLISIGFAILSLGKRQLELAFLMVISPLVIATSIGRKEQRSALYQQLASLVLQAGALMLLIGLTSITFNAVQNSLQINQLGGFEKTVAQSVLYLGCAMLLMTGCNALNRFIGDNVSANSGRDMMTGLMGIKSFAGGAVGGAIGAGVKTFGVGRGLFGLGQVTRGVGSSAHQKLLSSSDRYKNNFGKRMENMAGAGIAQILKGNNLSSSDNPLAKGYGKILEASGKHKYSRASKKWDIATGELNSDYKSAGSQRVSKGFHNIRGGFRNARRGY